METTGINLLNFMNSATSSVQTVLAKPSCFKRNTNHRRFLQKQLLQHHNDKDSTSLRLATTNAVQKPKHRTIKKIKSLTTKRKPGIWEQGCEFSHQIRVPSPSMDYLQYTELEEASFYQEHSNVDTNTHLNDQLGHRDDGLDDQLYFERNLQNQYRVHQYENNENFFNGHTTYNNFYHTTYKLGQEELPQPHSPTLSLSCCSLFSKNCEESRFENNIDYTDFLTGEELVMTLKESELFVPEIIYNENSLTINTNTEDYKNFFLGGDVHYGYNTVSDTCNSLSNVEDCCRYEETTPISDRVLNTSFDFDFW
ncbi:uncharacterized protein LOC124813837 [Hydra vulgaris]|uniref:uncharacterized protein LOC124813837 n=1 Tax=Hydra vulgaris TaxID=6087 RepID=UPI001F5F8D47|nr:uncharacterized protein LOC124813837 [Hydra vulgaris]